MQYSGTHTDQRRGGIYFSGFTVTLMNLFHGDSGLY